MTGLEGTTFMRMIWETIKSLIFILTILTNFIFFLFEELSFYQFSIQMFGDNRDEELAKTVYNLL
jgi:hypothetical protein